jgi:hypothetical protein
VQTASLHLQAAGCAFQPVPPDASAKMPAARGCGCASGCGGITACGSPDVVVEHQADAAAIQHRRVGAEERGGPPVFQRGHEDARTVIEQVVADEEGVEPGLHCHEGIAVFAGHGGEGAQRPGGSSPFTP